MNTHLFPDDSPIARNQGQVSSYRFDGENEAGVISTSKIRNASIGSAQIQDASIGSAQIGTISFNNISGGTATLGGTSNGNGVLQILNALGGTVVTANNQGITVNNGSITIKNTDGVTILDNAGIVSENSFLSDSFIDNADYTTSSLSFVDLGTEDLELSLDRVTQVMVFFYLEGFNNAVDFIDIQALDSIDGSLLNSSISGVFFTDVTWDSGTGLVDSVDYSVYDQPTSNVGVFPLSAGDHTIKLQFKSNAGGDSTVFVSSLGYLVLGS